MGWRSWLGIERPRAAVAMSGAEPVVRFSVDIPWLDPTQTGEPARGWRMSRDAALAVTAVLKGRNLIAGTISTLPVCTVGAKLQRVRVPLFEQIDPDVPNSVTMAMTVEDLLFEAISWWQVTARGYDGFPVSARHVDVRQVSFSPPPGTLIASLPSGYFPGSGVWIGGRFTPAADVIRFDSPNPPLLVAAARSIRRALKLEIAADKYADNPQARDYFTSTDDTPPAAGSDEESDLDNEVSALLDAWIAARQLRSTGFVPPGFQYNQVEQMSPVDLQLAQITDKVTRDLANAMCLDPEDLGVSTTSRTYQNAVDRRIDKVNECFGAYIQAIEDRLSMGDVTRRGQSVYLDLYDFLKANPIDLAAIQKDYLDMGVLDADEIRYDIRRPPLTPEQRSRLTPAPVAPPRPEHSNLATVTPIGAKTGTTGYHDRPAATFADDDPSLVFDMGDVAQSFAVNENKRTITGLVVPWNKVGRAGGRRWMFAKDSLKFDRATQNRIKLIIDHTFSSPVGRLVSTYSDDVGQWATFKVARGPEGDRALHMAADGVRDGFSVGIGHESDIATFTHSPHPADGTVTLVTSAPWAETSLTSNPAFSDARTSAVNMSADDPRGGAMPETATAPAETVAATAAASTQSITDAIERGFAAMAGQLSATATPPAVTFNGDALAETITTAIAAGFAAHQPEGPTVINPVRPGEVATVIEQPLYRFDGNRAQRTFSGDAVLAARGDVDARTRLQQYIETEMAARFNVSQANVAALNPVPTRAELFVPQLTYLRPLGDLVTTGGLDSAVPFIVPKFSSASGLVGDHSEGVEPTGGAYTATSQTITPGALSGKIVLNREMVDSGGNPQADQIIWQSMMNAWNEELETKIQVLLDGLGAAVTPIIGTDSDLDGSLTQMIAALQYVRGGNRFGSLAMASDLFSASIGAVDGNGRKLYPVLSPQNASGSTDGSFSRLQIGALTGVPSWALGADRSYLMVKGSVYQWNSAPTRFDFTQIAVATVEIGIWGYHAEACTRLTDVMELDYSEA